MGRDSEGSDYEFVFLKLSPPNAHIHTRTLRKHMLSALLHALLTLSSLPVTAPACASVRQLRMR